MFVRDLAFWDIYFLFFSHSRLKYTHTYTHSHTRSQSLTVTLTVTYTQLHILTCTDTHTGGGLRLNGIEPERPTAYSFPLAAGAYEHSKLDGGNAGLSLRILERQALISDKELESRFESWF